LPLKNTAIKLAMYAKASSSSRRDKRSKPKIRLMKTLPIVLAASILSFTPTFCVCGADSPSAQAVAVLHPTTGQHCHGIVHFIRDGDSVKVVADLERLEPGRKHAFHIHQYGDCSSSDGMSAGGHNNPEGHQHGLPDSEKRHAGDLGNVQADSEGKAHYEITVSNISIQGQKNPIIGRAVIVHAKPDDGGSTGRQCSSQDCLWRNRCSQSREMICPANHTITPGSRR
jgi:Cu-Zn family superoxide dismutase